MENASEYIVRIYLESQGYVVRTNQKFYYPKKIITKRGLQTQNTPIEVDILAIKHRKEKIVGEVKTWFGSRGCYSGCFKELWPKEWKGHDPFKVINNSEVERHLFKGVQDQYGKGFKYVLFLGKFQSDQERSKIYDYFATRRINGKEVRIIEFNEMIEHIIRTMKKRGSQYTNDRVLQTLKMLDFYGMLKEM